MKTKLMLAALALSATLPAYALEVTLQAPNKAGGMVQIWKRPCPSLFELYGAGPGLMITTSKKDGSVKTGCSELVADTGQILVTWEDSTRTVYHLADFDMPAPKAKAKTKIQPM